MMTPSSAVPVAANEIVSKTTDVSVTAGCTVVEDTFCEEMEHVDEPEEEPMEREDIEEEEEEMGAVRVVQLAGSSSLEKVHPERVVLAVGEVQEEAQEDGDDSKGHDDAWLMTRGDTLAMALTFQACYRARKMLHARQCAEG